MIKFEYWISKRKHLFEYYDGIPLIMIQSYKGIDHLLYAITWDKNLDKCEYMLTIINKKELEQVTTNGVKIFLESKLEQNNIYHYTFGYWEDSPKDKIRLFKKEEAIEAFPSKEFILDFDYFNNND